MKKIHWFNEPFITNKKLTVCGRKRLDVICQPSNFFRLSREKDRCLICQKAYEKSR